MTYGASGLHSHCTGNSAPLTCLPPSSWKGSDNHHPVALGPHSSFAPGGELEKM